MELKSVATILKRELKPTVKEWLRRVNLLPSLTHVALSDEDRALHLPEVFRDVASRLCLAADADSPIPVAAIAHGQTRRNQGYSRSMLVEESRLLEVVIFQTLHLHRAELDHDRLLSDIIAIADEVDLQLTQAVRCFETQPAQAVLSATINPPRLSGYEAAALSEAVCC